MTSIVIGGLEDNGIEVSVQREDENVLLIIRSKDGRMLVKMSKSSARYISETLIRAADVVVKK